MRKKQTTKERRRQTREQSCDPRNYLCGLEEILGECDAVVLYVRVSSHRQRRNGTLARHKTWLRMAMEIFGLRVVAIFADVEQGKHLKRKNRKTLVAAIDCAKRHGVPVVTHAASRFVRHRDWDFYQQELLPGDREFARLRELAGDVRLVTWLPPDAGHDTEHELFSTIRDNEGGRPRSPTDRRKLHKQEAMRLFRRGYSLGEVKSLLRVPKSTLQDWRNESKNGVYGFASKRGQR